MSKHTNFAKQLVKGRIAETIFAQMYRETGRFTVLEFGYERIIPELVQDGYDADTGIVETLRTAPDFAVIDKTKSHVQLVEVKYRSVMNNLEILKVAQRMRASWCPSYLFIATQQGFFFDGIDDIIENNGRMRQLSFDIVSQESQRAYLQLIVDFENN